MELILISALVLIIYINSLGNQFVSDDIGAILQNPQIKSVEYLFNPIWGFANQIHYFVLSNVFGPSPLVFRFLNILFHMGNSILIFFLLKAFYGKRVALFGSVIFASHPVFVESVTWISGGPYARYTFFFLASFLFYLKRNLHKRFYAVSILLFFICLQINEKAIPLWLLFPFFEYFQKSLLKNWKLLVPYFVLSLIYTAIHFGRLSLRREGLAQDYQQESLGLDNPLVQIPIAISEYLKLLIWPNNLTLYHTELNFSKEEFYIRAFITVVFISFSIIGFFKKRFFSFWFGWFLISLLVTLTPFRISWIVAERYVYLGAIGIITVFSVVLNNAIIKFKIENLYWSILTLLIIPLSILTVVRNADWKNQDSLWIATAKTSPTSSQNHNNLGDMYGRWGDLKMAILEFETAIKLKPNYADAYHNLANTYQQLEEYDKAIENYKKAIKFNPNLWQSYQNIGVIYYHKKNLVEANKYFNDSLKINPTNENLKKLVEEINNN